MGEYDDFDYVVRANTAEELKFKANATLCLGCKRQYAGQLAICYRIGFGVRRDIDVSQSWLATAGMTGVDLQSAIDKLAERYVLTGRLTDQVRDALGIGVLVSTDRTQQYRVQGRILAAEQSISSEILAREAELGELHFSLSKLKSDLVQIYKAQSRSREAKQLQEEIVSICANKHGERHPSVLAAKATLAAIFADEGLLLQAEKSQRELQPLFEEVLGKEHPETVIALQGWGATLHNQARYREAADVFRKVRAVRANTLTDDHPLTIRADICLAAALHGQGLLQEADQLMSRIASSSAHSGDAVIEAHVHMSLANLYRDQSRLQEAEEAANRAIKILRRKVSQDDPIRLDAEEVLAVIYGQKRDFAKQETLLRSILQAKAVLNQATPYVSTTRTFLASNLLKQGRIEDSVTEAQGVLDALNGSVALDAENYLACIQILATAASRRGKVTEAEKLRSDLLATCLQNLRPKDPNTLHARSFLADHYAEQGRFDEAVGLQKDNLQTLEEDGECGKFAAQAARELALSSRELSRFQEAIELCEKAILWSRKGVGDEHNDTVAIYNILAGTYLQRGSLADADALYQSKVVPHVAGTDLEMYVLESMAELRRAQGRIPESTNLSKQALDLTLQRLGEMHPTSIKMAGNVLGFRLTQEPLTPELEQEVLVNIERKSELLGFHHFSTIKTQSDLAYAYGEMGRKTEAEALYNTIEAGDGQGVNLENVLRYATYLAKRADLSYRSEDFGRAQLLEEQALRLRQGLLPPEHSAVLVSMMNLAATLNAQRKYDEAEPLIHHVVSLRETHVGLDAPPTLAAKNDLAAVLYFKGKLADSEALWWVVVEATRRTNLSSALLQQRMAQLYHVQEAQRQQNRDVTEDST
jgi:tetratricopeptide (TPR) repeat protein